MHIVFIFRKRLRPNCDYKRPKDGYFDPYDTRHCCKYRVLCIAAVQHDGLRAVREFGSFIRLAICEGCVAKAGADGQNAPLEDIAHNGAWLSP